MSDSDQPRLGLSRFRSTTEFSLYAIVAGTGHFADSMAELAVDEDDVRAEGDSAARARARCRRERMDDAHRAA